MEHFNKMLSGDSGALKRALYKASNHTDENLKKPLIAIANSYTDASPGHVTLNEIASHVKKGIKESGGEVFEFGIIAPCDGIAEGHLGMRYTLPSRDLIASSIESMVRSHAFDGLVLIGSCDKIVPGMLMAAARLEMPSIFINSGPMKPACYNGKKYDGNIITEAIGWKNQCLINEEEFKNIENLAEPGPGSCSMYGTANTMGAIAEAIGMSLPGSALIPAESPERNKVAFQTGEQIVNMVKNQFTTKSIFTKPAFENAIRVLLSSGGSTNAVLHLQAIYYDAGLGYLPLEEFDKLSKETPLLAKIYPASQHHVVDFHYAGGIQGLFKQLGDKINQECLNVSMKKISDNNLNLIKVDENIIKSLIKENTSHIPGLAVLKGNLASEGSICKPAAIKLKMMNFKGKAKVFNSEDECNRAIMEGKIKPQTAIVLRYEGPKGAPGMPEMYHPMKLLEGNNLSDSCAIITDGRFSGSNRGLFVGHISPEAKEGGLIAYVEDNDEIEISVDKNLIQLNVSNEIIEKRKTYTSILEKEVPRGYLKVYRKIASSASKGAIIE